MLKPVIAVFDKKIGLFDNPFVVRKNGEAIREWEHVTQDKSNRYGKNPEDYDLYQIANYDEATGAIVAIQPHIQLAQGLPVATRGYGGDT